MGSISISSPPIEDLDDATDDLPTARAAVGLMQLLLAERATEGACSRRGSSDREGPSREEVFVGVAGEGMERERDVRRGPVW